ncbi:murein hydrolase activator EnvC family protein [Pseudomonas mangrovi]|uniref:Peptidase M23 n=1 Tax=Pseudomonas mangrovi TaxID=2161748 RepID=A0A2T5P940_9PSED|nr:murein hydrolase activator EnvC [Pseudomonas mangrovi]PTU74258.1 peptidase M23 [Pseudomonas mangrovi]
MTLRIPIALLLACLLVPAIADERAQTREQLEAARKDVAELKQLLEKIQQEKSALQQSLKKTETEMGTLEKEVRELQNELGDGEKELKRLDQEKKKLQSARDEQQRLIAVQARAAYQSGRQEYLRLLLNQQHPEKFSRALTYHDYLSRARIEQLDTFNETLRQLGNIQADIDRQQAVLLVRKSELEERTGKLGEVRKERRLALAKLERQQGDQNQRLKTRQQEQAQLDRLLKTIEETLARQAREAEEARRQAAIAAQNPTPSTAASGPRVATGSSVTGPFSRARGQLPWPVDGQLVARYGTPRGGDARTKWDGVLIGAGAGTQVHAIHAGRVVFADWLRGAGLLVILDHGDGYLSLYGHNQSLLKEAGAQVRAGEAIATVGASGGQDAPGLYFAIRQQGRPIDPAQWCRTQG